MKKILLSLFAFAAMSANAQTTFDFTNPTGLGFEESDTYLANPTDIKSGDVTLTFDGTGKSNRVFNSTTKATPGGRCVCTGQPQQN